MSTSPGMDADPIWELLCRFALDWVRDHFLAAVQELGLSPPQGQILLELDHPSSQRRLATGLRLDPSSLVGIIDRLEARGLVERTADPGDRRVNRLVLTPTGRRLRDELATRVFTPPVASSLNAEERAQLEHLLRREVEGWAGPA